MWRVVLTRGAKQEVVYEGSPDGAVAAYLRMRTELLRAGHEFVDEDFIGTRTTPGEYFTTASGITVTLQPVE